MSAYFGSNVLDRAKLETRLPRDAYAKLVQTIEQGKRLDPETAAAVAGAIKEWALGCGVTHFCHWFQPQTGSTAEKHDAFLSFDERGRTVEKFSGSQLIQSEPDASSFPSGGMRTTFEARGYTAWDPSSPVFIVEHTNGKTLCVPCVFISYHGAALDEKTALLRSIDALSAATAELLTVLGDAPRKVVAMLGVEQEYFLIDRAFHSLRPDLLMSGRTLIGGQPPKGQQLEDHYFGSIPARVLAFMTEAEHELCKLGVPVKTRHNEVAPSQFETAPIFEEASIATDHNQLTMEVLRKVALRHSFASLLHEKPFAGINGSGKHCNWSLCLTGSGGSAATENLLEPGKTPHENLRFLLVLMAVLKGVHRHAGLLRAGVASSGNDHRLGANEAPPAIISVFLGDLLTRILTELETGSINGQAAEQVAIRLGVGKLPEVMKDNTDRNRTSPFAFTGNRFEFRAVGSSASPAFPVTLLNAAVADGLGALVRAITAKIAAGETRDHAILAVIRDAIQETRAIRFEGNNYSEDWVREAERRGLPNLKKTPEALEQLVCERSREMLTRLGIFSEGELTSRFHVRTERYVKNLLIEVDTLIAMVDTQVLPASYAYAAVLEQAGPVAHDALERLCVLAGELRARRERLEAATRGLDKGATEIDRAHHIARTVAPAMLEVRESCDRLEAIVADDHWPLPKYREMLFLA
ncbi:MAG: glutamine synthetase III [Polyangiaceae bacterium]|nr:glutamine synthetase III [Polyangiaceae bacterium]